MTGQECVHDRETRVESIARLLPPIYEDLRLVDVARLRRIIRLGAYEGHTGGLAVGRLQASLVVVPRSFASDFHRFCVNNPKACPLVAVGRAGSPFLPTLGDVDVRTDIPQYEVYRLGELIRQQPDILDIWREDFAAFALGSSSTFEHALIERGVAPRNFVVHRVAPMFRSSIRTTRVGVFGGDMVVSMRPVRLSQVDTVRAVTARFPHAHGAPIHVGDPRVIGIEDIGDPDWGDPVEVREGEVPVFWASGATAQSVVAGARLEVAIVQTPGHMLITDVAARENVGAFKIY
jgi:uncharacterized protein YcsI (UPF0317 family)